MIYCVTSVRVFAKDDVLYHLPPGVSVDLTYLRYLTFLSINYDKNVLTVLDHIIYNLEYLLITDELFEFSAKFWYRIDKFV